MKTAYIETSLSKPSKLSVKQEVKKKKEKDINYMGSWAIIWHLLRRHKLGISFTMNIMLIAYVIKQYIGF